MHNITFFKPDITTVDPVDKSFVWVEVFENFVLFATIVNFDLHLTDTLLLKELCLVL